MELFEAFDEQGASLGLVARDEVHKSGLWHRSAQVFVFHEDGRLLLQQRASDKDLYADLWDYSVGEHLQPGETFVAGAARGLREELAITGTRLIELGGIRRVELHSEAAIDREIQQAFACVYEGAVRIDPVEVQAIGWVTRDALLASLADSPDRFTPWFRQDIAELGLADGWDTIVEALQTGS